MIICVLQMTNIKAKRLGLYGGSFNPIHMGHLRAAEETREALGLEKIIFIPSNISPHKDASELIDARHRMRMTELAVQSNPYFECSDVELRREGPSYTIDTLRYYNSLFPDGGIYFLVGNELFSEIDTWRDWEALFELANFVVLTRPGYSNKNNYELPIAVRNLFRYDKAVDSEQVYKHPANNELIVSYISGIEVSSTQIRNLVERGKSIKYLVDEKVEQYIIKCNIYS